MKDLKELQREAKDLKVLYVEDNDALREKASKLIGKFFDNLYVAYDGVNGLELFKEHLPQIVITDINMPKMNGIDMSRHIKEIAPDTKIIIMSAFDDKEYLFKAIEIGVYRYLNKPVEIAQFKEVIFSVVDEMKKEQDTQLFNTNLKNVFNYQSSIVLMLKNSEPTFANQVFLEYFGVKNIEEFVEKHGDIGSLLLKHDGFLYNKPEKNWFDEISQHSQKLYNIKIKDKNENLRHFVLKYQKIPNKESYGILSFDDLTQLNLLKLYDDSQIKSKNNVEDTKAMFKLLEIIQRNSAKVQLHNYYYGLSITNDASIVELKENSIVLKTNFLQLKSIQIELQSIITSDALPEAIEGKYVNINFKDQTVELKELSFSASSAVNRKTVRIAPEEKHNISLFLGENKFLGNIKIEDISLDAVRLKLDSLPAGLKIDGEVVVEMFLSMDEKSLNIKTKAVIFKKSESEHAFEVILIFKLTSQSRTDLIKYITNRQMAIIREFKGKQNG
ncbi:response regulator transcription factor [Candidatus Sulfurimonas baltica]|uniref:Response regulator n=1 Tax=Candidatus Sulfurimonas baltica TaxID=2740404 RepID=A0A7S7LTL2_9BACT|nr:response regulator [Candidatus Sulfurimonas baltica]QOY51050.1 response regulator [Candidatus Sulfurimonas baltica]